MCAGVTLIHILIHDSYISNLLTFSFISFKIQRVYSYLLIKFYIHRTISKLFPFICYNLLLSIENISEEIDFENLNDDFASIKSRKIKLQYIQVSIYKKHLKLTAWISPING